jgi:uncharacterized damage-inducible protein DinB
MTQGEILSDSLRRALHGEAWHGPALQELIAPISAEESVQRPIPTAHNILELVLHIASWSRIARRRIEGGHVEPYDGEDWPDIVDVTADRWDEARAALAEGYERLSKIVSGMTDEELLAKAPRSDRTIAGMIDGVAQHAAYHGGQIALLRKIVSTHHRRTAL